jgi:hypothetical protein
LSPAPSTGIPGNDDEFYEYDEFNKNRDSDDDVIDAAMNTQIMAEAEHEVEEERVAHMVFGTKQQQRRGAAVVEDDDNGSEPDLDEKAAKQRAILASFETLKKAEDDAKLVALQQRLLEDVAAHCALAST